MLTPQAILETGSRSLRTFQIALGTTSHNMTNVQTEGYTRQRVDLEASRPLPSVPGQLGTGVLPTQVQRSRVSSFDFVVRGELSQFGRWDLDREVLGQVESIFGAATQGSVGSALTAYWNGWNDVAAYPEDLGVRQALVERAATLGEAFRSSAARLDAQNASLNQSVSVDVDAANGYLNEIAQLNVAINRAEFGGNHANDLRDSRDVLLDKLSALADLNIVEQPNGMVDVDVGGQVLVTGPTASTLSAVLNVATGHMEVQLGGVPLAFTSGRFQGYSSAFAAFDATRASLDQHAAALISEVNTLHTTGFDLTGSAAGVFFTGTDAATLDVSAALKSNPALVGASASGAPGDNGIALQLAQMRNTKTIPQPPGTPTMTLNEAHAALVVSLGAQSRQAQELASVYGQGLQSAKDRRSAVSGVNMDEEVANLLSYQRAYEASARVVTVVDELMDRIINHMGHVGTA